MKVIYCSILTKKENFYFKNQLVEGVTKFKDYSIESGLAEYSSSMSISVFDYDLDGDLDLLVSNMDDAPFFYENQIVSGQNDSSNHWISLRLVGTLSNHDGLGSHLKLWSGGQVQYRLYSGAGLMEHSLNGVHFGLGQANQIDSLEITWDLGLIEKYYEVPVDHFIRITENVGMEVLDLQNKKVFGCTDPNSCTYDSLATVNDGSCTYLSAREISGPAQSGYLRTEQYTYPGSEGSTFSWQIEHGHILYGQGTSTITVQWEIHEMGSLSVRENSICDGEWAKLDVQLFFDQMEDRHSVARLWNEALLYAIRNDFARPTVHARNLFHISVAMYDAWATYDDKARTYILGNQIGDFKSDFDGFETAQNEDEAVKESISFAAYRLLAHRFLQSPGVKDVQRLTDRLMNELGYDQSNTSIDYGSGDPAALGNFIAQTLIDYGLQDGATELQQYANAYYNSVNQPLVTTQAGNPNLKYPNRWQPLALETFIDQAGNLIDGSTPEFLSPEWGNVQPFAMETEFRTSYERGGQTYYVFHDPGMPPNLDTLMVNSSSELYKWGFTLVSVWGSHLDPNDGVHLDISPASIGDISSSRFPENFQDYPNFYNRLEGGDIGQGRALNPMTNEPYISQIVPRGDYARVLAEFWADGPDSETPPGHWFVILNTVNDHPQLEKRLEGEELNFSNMFIIQTCKFVSFYYDFNVPILQ